jgi:hypothetical protein
MTAIAIEMPRPKVPKTVRARPKIKRGSYPTRNDILSVLRAPHEPQPVAQGKQQHSIKAPMHRLETKP